MSKIIYFLLIVTMAALVIARPGDDAAKKAGDDAKGAADKAAGDAKKAGDDAKGDADKAAGDAKKAAEDAGKDKPDAKKPLSNFGTLAKDVGLIGKAIAKTTADAFTGWF